MIFGTQRQSIRQLFFTSWQNYQQQQLLSPLETQVVDIILLHPEYHEIFSHEDKYIDKDYLPEFGETNPFLHLALHISIREQLATNRPNGIADIYQKLIQKIKDSHQVEHQMIDCLAESLWQAQRNNQMPNEQAYLDMLRDLL